MIVTNGIFRIRKSFATSNAASRVAVVIFVVPSGVSGWHCTMNICFSLSLFLLPRPALPVFTPQPQLHPIYVGNRTYAQVWRWGRNRGSNGVQELFCVLVFVLLLGL